ncbi:MAG: hypothetical protein OXN97_18060 [Bryobacterales bacterium]|nr:hypothetical protein [Bryobacterales bacterium]
MHEYRIFDTDQFPKDLQSITQASHKEIVGRLRRSVRRHLCERFRFGPQIGKLKGHAP